MEFLFIFLGAVAGLGVGVFFSTKRQPSKLKVEPVNNNAHITAVENAKVKLYTEIEKERHRIAKAIHDRFGARLAVSVQRIEQLYTNPQENWPAEELQSILTLLRDNMEEMRQVVWDIAPAELEYVSLGDAVEEFCRKTQNLIHQNTRIHFVEGGHITEISTGKKQLLYNMLVELITNAIKHSEASNIDVALNWDQEQLICEVSDDGKGLKLHYINSPKPKTQGLATMRARAFELGGTFDKEVVERGCRFVISVPLIR